MRGDPFDQANERLIPSKIGGFELEMAVRE